MDRRCAECAPSMDGVRARSRTPCAAVVCQALCALRQTGARTPSDGLPRPDEGAGAEKAGGGSWQTRRQENPLPGALNIGAGIMLNPTLLTEGDALVMQPNPSLRDRRELQPSSSSSLPDALTRGERPRPSPRPARGGRPTHTQHTPPLTQRGSQCAAKARRD